MSALLNESLVRKDLAELPAKRLTGAIWPALLVGTISLFLGLALGSFGGSLPIVKLQEVPSMESCVDEMKRVIDPASIQNLIGRAATIRAVQEACYDRGHKQAELNEYQIRRMQFFEQYYDERIILWMVVVITVSGVALAGVQLAASYRLSLLGRAVSNKPSELTVEHGRIVLRSSALGLFILIISFAFFFVFVTQMYPTKEVAIGGDGLPQTPGQSAASQVKTAPTTPPTTVPVAPPINPL